MVTLQVSVPSFPFYRVFRAFLLLLKERGISARARGRPSWMSGLPVSVPAPHFHQLHNACQDREWRVPRFQWTVTTTISATAFPPPYFTRGSTHQRGSILPLTFPSTKFGTRCDGPGSWCARGATTTTTGPADYLSCHPFLSTLHIAHGTKPTSSETPCQPT